MTVLPLPPLPARVRTSPAANATLAERTDLTETIARFRVRPDAGVPSFRAGQYFAVGLPLEDRLLQRPYSAASPPGDPEVELLVRLVPHGDFTPRLWKLPRGARVHLGRARGLFMLEPDDRRTHLLLATGTGLAPLLAMLHELKSRPRPPCTVLVHGAATRDELAARDTLATVAARAGWLEYVPAVSRPSAPANAGWSGATGRLDALVPETWRRLGLDPATTVAYLCGNPGMVAGTVAVLRGLGLPDGSIRREEYWSP